MASRVDRALAGAPVFVDRLEARMYMSGDGFVPFDTATEFSRVIVSTATSNFVQYTDANGNTVKASITGGGTISAFFIDDTNADPAKILVTPSPGGKSSVVFTVTKSKAASSDLTSVGDVVVEGGLVNFTAGKVNLTGDMTVSGTVKAVTLNDVNSTEQQSITIGGSAFDKTSLTFGRLAEVSILSIGTVASFKAVEWLDNNDQADGLKAFSLGGFSITGSKAGSTGDLMADVQLTQAVVGKAAPVIGQFQVAGSVAADLDFGVHKIGAMTLKAGAAGNWFAEAGFGSVQIIGQASGLSIISGRDIGSLTLKAAGDNISIQALGNVGSVNAVAWIDSALSATKVGSFSVKGSPASKGGPAVAGDFSGMLNINPLGTPGTGVVLGSVNIAGHVSGSNIEVNGKAGSFQVGAITDSTFKFQSDVANFTSKGQAVGSAIEVAGTASSISLVNWLSGQITVNKVNTFSTKGLAASKGAAAVAGDFKGELRVLGLGAPASASIAGSINITGTLDAGMLNIQGKSGVITGGAVVNSSIDVFGALTGLTVKTQVVDTVLLVDSVGAVSVGRWLGGDIFANKVGSISTKDQAASKSGPAIPGDFSGNLTITANGLAANASALGSVKVAGAIFNARWEINGKSGAISVGSASNTEFNLFGDLAGFTSKLAVTDTSISANNVGAVVAMSWANGLISASKITSISTKGLAPGRGSAGTPGDFTAQVQVSAEGVTGKASALGSIMIAGTMRGASISVQGNSGVITVGAVEDSSVQVGLNMPSFSIPTSRADFVSVDATLAGFVVTGKAVANPNTSASFVNTIVAAGVLNNVSLKRVDVDVQLPNGFYAGSRIGTYTRQTGPSPANTFKLTPGNRTAPGSYDTAVGEGSGYRLVIVPVNA